MWLFQVILLIYEYAIAVESSLVQSKRRGIRRNDTVNATNDTPFADRLDRSYFGFDQDYYERMPLLVNALQENSYIDPTADAVLEQKDSYLLPPKVNVNAMNNYKTAHVRRTSPRPFYFEYKSPTPVPFSKTYRSKSWIESYRNAQRLKNIQQVIKYLEKTINAKIGDMYTAPSSNHIAFTGVYVEPSVVQDKSYESSDSDLAVGNSNKQEGFKQNHQPDPLFRYKPENAGEVNLLADGFLRFSPTTGFGRKDLPNIPMFRPIPSYKKKCFGLSCDDKKITDSSSSSSETQFDHASNYSKAKSFSVMLNVFPLKTNLDPDHKKIDTPKPPVDKIYLTTSKPLVLFKRKSTNVGRRRNIIKRPRILKPNMPILHEIDGNPRDKINDSNVILQINVFTPDKKTESTTKVLNITEPFIGSTPINNVNYIPVSTTEAPYYSSTRTTEYPFVLSTTQVQDFHVGSSGVIPVEDRVPPPTTLPPTLPKVTTLLPFFDVTLSSTEGPWVTQPPDIIKFSHEDAKIPDEYRQYRESDVSENIFSDISRRNFRDSFDFEDFESRTLVTKLRNELEHYVTTTEYSRIEDSTRDTTSTTQINGHYRSVNRNSKIVNTLLDPNSEVNRKRRLNLFAKGFRRANFSLNYVEINRNSSTT